MNILFVTIRTRSRELVEEPGLSAIAAYVSQQDIRFNCRVVQIFALDTKIDSLLLELRSFSPEILAFSLYDDDFEMQIDVVRKFSIFFPDSTICAGGYSPTYHGRELMVAYPFIDICVIGEGELAMCGIASSIGLDDSNQDLNSVAGIIYRNGETLKETGPCMLIENLDSLPFTNRDILQAGNYNLAQIATSRGCIGRCSFCSSSSFWRDGAGRRKYRYMSTKRVVDEIEYVLSKYRRTRFVFNDNSYEDPSSSIERQLDIAYEIIKRRLHISYNVNYRAGFYQNASTDFMRVMIASGLSSIFLGIEAFNDIDLDIYQKGTTLLDNENALSYFSSFKELGVSIGFININPYSTIERIQQNLHFLHRYGYANDLSNFASKLRVYRGTEIYGRIFEDGLLRGDFSENHCYSFVDERVALLDSFLMSIDHDLLRDSGFYCDRFRNIIRFLKRWFFDISDQIAYDIVVDAEKEYVGLLSELNELSYVFFDKITSLAAGCWNEKQACELKNEYIPVASSFVARLHRKRNYLISSLMRINSAYISLF